MNMKDKNDNNVLVGDTVNICGDKDHWTIMTDQDDFGDVTIKCNTSGDTLQRHPKSLVLCA